MGEAADPGALACLAVCPLLRSRSRMTELDVGLIRALPMRRNLVRAAPCHSHEVHNTTAALLPLAKARCIVFVALQRDMSLSINQMLTQLVHNIWYFLM